MQDDSADKIFEQFQDIVQQAILREFPNPERKGCPGSHVLRELANRPRPTRDAAWEHVTHCSPCYREFLDLRAEVQRQIEARHRQAMRRRLLVGGATTIAVGVAIAIYETFPFGGVGSRPGSFESASLDLKNRSVTRGVEGQNPRTQPLVLPAKRLELTIYLPIGSEPGPYDIQLLREIDKPLLTASGQARIEHGLTVLRTRLDLAGHAPGSFLIGLRQPPSDWTYYPVSIR